LNYNIPENLQEFIQKVQNRLDLEPIGLIRIGVIIFLGHMAYSIYYRKFKSQKLFEGVIDFSLLMYFPLLT
jgi:hypothetical protein